MAVNMQPNALQAMLRVLRMVVAYPLFYVGAFLAWLGSHILPEEFEIWDENTCTCHNAVTGEPPYEPYWCTKGCPMHDKTKGE
jgi:hypothetical protein